MGGESALKGFPQSEMSEGTKGKLVFVIIAIIVKREQNAGACDYKERSVRRKSNKVILILCFLI